MNKRVFDYIQEVMKKVDEKKTLVKNSKSLVCFRGENQNFQKTSLMPSLFRYESGILLEKEMIDLLSDYDIPDSKDLTNLSKIIASQHYLQLSRLLDISFSLLPAIYFASENEKEDGYLYSFVFPESFSPNSEYLIHYYDNLVNEKFVPYSKDFKVITHSYNNQRLKLQSGGFILFGGEAFNRIPKEYYCDPTVIAAKDKAILRKELSDYFNLNESTIFPEKDKRKTPILNTLSSSKKTRFTEAVFFDNELEYILRRINFETSLKIEHSSESSKDILRYLRKENENVINYIDKNYSIEDRILNYEKVQNTFLILELGVKKCNKI